MKKQTKLGLVLAAAAVISVSVASLVSAKGWVQNGADWYYVDNSGEYVTDTIQSSGNAKFYLGEDGAMQRDYFLEDYNNNTYYFGQNGAMVTNTWVAIESSRVENQEDYVPDNYWYYFQASGKAMKGTASKEKKTTIDGKKYAFNQYGQMLTGWITGDGKVVADDAENPFADAKYYAGGDNDGVLRSGWLTYYDGYDQDTGIGAEYTNLYFYFNTSNNEKYGFEKKDGWQKKINGKNYAFSSEGVMMSGWDVYELDTTAKTTYFSTEDDGHQVKKGWVYAVPAESIDEDANKDDEEKYMYFDAAGAIVKDQFRKINGKFYVFNAKGIMKTGVVLWAPNDTTKFAGTLNLDYAEGADLSKKGILTTGDGKYYKVAPNGKVISSVGIENAKKADTQLKLHLFGSDGARKTGTNNVDFSDDTYVLTTNASNGDKGSGVFAKKYYSLGIQVKANPDIRYGIFNKATTPSDAAAIALAPQEEKWFENLASNNSVYAVLNTSGTLVKGNNAAKKDADGNFWYIEKGTDALKGIWTVNVKANASIGTSFKSKNVYIPSADINGFDFDADFTLADLAATESIANAEEVVANWVVIDELEDAVRELKWKLVKNDAGNYYLQPASSVTTYGYYAESLGDKSNVWAPFGFLDNTGKTVSFADTREDYRVTPNDDYFLNCYWND